MDRRTAIRTLATATALPVLAPGEATALLEARRTISVSASAGFVPAALTQREFDIVGLVADIILPRTDTPGALDVGVPAFVDLIVSEWMTDEDADELRAGLAALDASAMERFGAPFPSCADDERFLLVRELDQTLPAPGSAADVPAGFYRSLKRLVLIGYFTTEAGSEQTGYRLRPGTYGGCVAPEAGR